MTTKERRMLQCMSFLFFPLLVVGAYTACKVYDEYLDGYYYNITELGVAAVKNNDDAIDNLVNSGCDVNYNGTGVTWMNLKYVYQQGEEEYTYEEYSYGDEYHGEDFSILYGETALHIAVNHASIEVVKKLVEIPEVNIVAKSGRGETALHDAASFGLSKIIKILVSAGADLETENKDGYTPLQSAAMYGQVDGVKTLALLKADLNAVGGNESVSALTMAAQMGFPDVVRLLLEMGADPDVKDKNGKTAGDWAIQLGYSKLEKPLLNWSDKKSNV